MYSHGFISSRHVRAFFDSQFAEDARERAAAETFLTQELPAERAEVQYEAAAALVTAN